MGTTTRKWIIRDVTGQISGPYSTEKVLYLIGRGELSGDEHIALYPNGRWIPMSQDARFYDKLLEVLAERGDSEPIDDTHVIDFTRPKDAPTIRGRARSRSVSDQSEAPTGDAIQGQRSRAESVDEPAKDSAPPRPDDPTAPGHSKTPPSDRKKSKKKKRRRRPHDIELVDVRPQIVRQILSRARGPIFALLAGLALASMFLLSGKSKESRLHLLAPQKNITQVDGEALKGRVRQGIQAFLKDTLDSYQQAQNDLIYVVERNTKNTEVMAWLCMTYLQLWPYAYQDSTDSKVITQLLQMSSAANPGGRDAATCRAVDLITRARWQEAKSLVETQLELQATETNPPVLFYFLKGELLASSNEHASAVGYLQSAQQLLPQWILPQVIEAHAQVNQEKYSEAQRIYVNVLKANPAHTVARIELGLLEYQHFNHAEQGERYLRQALEREDAPRTTLSRGYFGLAEIARNRGDNKQSLKYAQRAYSLNSSNSSAKNLIVTLGGVQKLRDTKVKGQQLMFEGDQFFREGDCHAAQAFYKAAFEDDQTNAQAAIKAAQCLWKLSFSTEAMEWLQRAIKADPKMIEAYVYLADYQAQRYNYLAASKVLEQAKRVNPKSSEVYRGFAMLELRRGNPKGAIIWGKRAREIYGNDVETLILLAQASLALRDPKMAYNYSNQAKELDVNNREAQILFSRSMAGLQGIDAGTDYLLKLVNNYPLVLEYRLALGRMFAADERYQQAEEIFRRITHLEEKSKDAYMELSKVLRAQNQMGEALDLLLKAAVLDPADAEPLFLAGLVYLDLRKPKDAAVQFQRVLTINKLYPLVNYQLGRTALVTQDAKAALQYAELEKRANPNLPEAYILAAEAHTLLAQYSNCSTEYGKALKLRPQPASIYVKMAICNRKAGQLDSALALLNVAATKESGYADIYKELGALYELKGDVNKAIEAYQNYFVLDPDAPDREQIERRISSLQSGGRL